MIITCVASMLGGAHAVSCEVVPQMALLGTVLYMGAAYQQIRRDVYRVLHEFAPKQEEPTAQQLEELQLKFKRLQLFVHDLDGVFAGFSLFTFVKDIICLAAVLGAAITARDPTDNPYAKYVARDMTVVIGGLGLVNACIKFGICIACQETVPSIKVALQRTAVFFHDAPIIRSKCESFIVVCGDHSNAITVGGFYRIDREFIRAIAEIVLTYGILIYQTHDTKMDIRGLVSNKHFEIFEARMGKCAGFSNHSLALL
ncbi:uncharacterized protein LOC129590650 [Paramacrobiotus metropolitanus]|uniref:uncharacterized protein LOC129590650 n=1 Tax=Paramacrobiotus metropolitanus TaxID=2943436 RepID=UPI002445E1FB|nr:uncharacterized protein LOC129590650 [Paramacrobiotus metropolitanus]